LPIHANVEDERIVLDLRCVFPRHDAAIAAAISVSGDSASRSQPEIVSS
jgi:hypothetical protein